MCNEISDTDIKYFRAKIIKWGRTNFRNFPWRYSDNKWHCLAAEIMLQRTKAEQVEPVYVEFIRKYEKPENWLDDPDAVTFNNLGLPERNKQFLSLNRIIAGNEIPDNKVDLLKLPGVGDYIASAFLSLHLGMRASLIDSNIVRVYGRYFGLNTNAETRRKIWLIELADRITPKRNHRCFNYALIDFSREICKTRSNCRICTIKRKCNYFHNIDN